ncbi:hypothetical protein [Nocardia colli]|uniref:hypothetical protein n=1 Tax=Nocardia colli TaxID=2545717 RepID=UPI0035DDEAAD
MTLTLLNVTFAVVGPVASAIIGKPLGGVNDLLVGIMLFSAGALVEILYYLATLRERVAREDAVWDSHSNIDSKLSSIRKSLRSLENGVDPENDIFLRYFSSRVNAMEVEARQTAGDKELRVDSQNLDLSDPLLDSFTGNEADIIRIVHFLSRNDALFNVHEAQWFYQVHSKVLSRRLNGVRRLLIFSNDQELNDERTKQLIGFLEHTDHYDYRLISNENFQRLSRSFRLQGEFKDFGIYGTKYLFRGLLYADNDFVGVYSRDAETITRYIHFFDFCLQSPTSRRSAPDEVVPIGIDELFRPYT